RDRRFFQLCARRGTQCRPRFPGGAGQRRSWRARRVGNENAIWRSRMVRRVVRVGTRSSALAQAQTDLIAAALLDVDPGLQIERVIISTNGDRTQHSNAPGPDWGTGVFVKEIEGALLGEEIDLAVHSLQDVPPLVTAE